MTTQPNTKCTCPSGDGSLRWPCPKHPPAAAPAEMSPEFSDTARAAIAWVLWHHQGASSPVGLPLRFALGMGAYEPLPDWRIAEAKRYAAWAGATTAKFHEARAITPAAPGIDLADVSLAAQMLTWGREEGLTDGQIADIDAHAQKLFALIEQADASPKSACHPDDAAVNAFAAVMKAKLADARAKGRGGWNGDEPGMQQRLSDMLREHVEKGDPRDVANFCMFLHQRGEWISAPAPIPRPMDTAPRDGTVVRLLVQFEEHLIEDTDEPAWTIGACNDDLVPDDERTGWQVAGWCWEHDHFTEGKGTPVGWLPMLDSPKGGSEAQPMFYIQDTRGFVGNCPMWWGPDGRGYVTRLDEAGRYTEEEAIRQNKARDTDIPWPCDEIDKLARPTVDFQHMRPRSERLAELAAQAGDAEVQP